MNVFFAELGVQYVDHFAVTTPNLLPTLQDWLALPNSRLIKGPASNENQRVNYAFVAVNSSATVELLSPLDDNSPICQHLQKGGGADHFCFAVKDLEKSIKFAESAGAKLIITPTADIAFDQRRIAFLFHQYHGLFELVESQPEFLHSQDQQNLVLLKKNDSIANELSKKLLDIVHYTFPTSKGIPTSELKLNSVSEWDSLGQLRLMMNLENKLNMKIPIDIIVRLQSFEEILDFITNQPK